jgi:hypothetical protein
MSYVMKYGVLIAFGVFFASLLQAQLQVTEPDKSPMDMSFHPHGYPILKFQSKNAPATPKARVIYSRPQKNGRTIFGDIVKYGEVWRMGANETAEIEFYQDVTIAGKKIARGRYTLYGIPQASKWTLILNKQLDTWGSFSYNKDQDVVRADAPVAAIDNPIEYFTMVFDNAGVLTILWDTVKVVLPIKYATK